MLVAAFELLCVSVCEHDKIKCKQWTEIFFFYWKKIFFITVMDGRSYTISETRSVQHPNKQNIILWIIIFKFIPTFIIHLKTNATNWRRHHFSLMENTIPGTIMYSISLIPNKTNFKMKNYECNFIQNNKQHVKPTPHSMSWMQKIATTKPKFQRKMLNNNWFTKKTEKAGHRSLEEIQYFL